MDHILYSIMDKKVGEYMPPFVVPNLTTALRGISQALSEPTNKSPMALYPHDFALYEVGTFNSKLGRIESLANPAFVEEISNLIVKKG